MAFVTRTGVSLGGVAGGPHASDADGAADGAAGAAGGGHQGEQDQEREPASGGHRRQGIAVGRKTPPG